MQHDIDLEYMRMEHEKLVKATAAMQAQVLQQKGVTEKCKKVAKSFSTLRCTFRLLLYTPVI